MKGSYISKKGRVTGFYQLTKKKEKYKKLYSLYIFNLIFWHLGTFTDLIFIISKYSLYSKLYLIYRFYTLRNNIILLTIKTYTVTIFFSWKLLQKYMPGQCIGVKGIVFCQVTGSIQIISKEIFLSTWDTTCKWSAMD